MKKYLFLLFSLSTFIIPHVSFAALAIDPSTPATIKSNAQTLTTASFTPPAGSVLYIVVGLNSCTSGCSANKITSITDNLGSHLTYTQQLVEGTENGADVVSYLYTAPVTGSGAMTVSAVQQSANTFRYAFLKVLVVTGANTVTPVGIKGGGRGITGVVNDTYTSTSAGSWGWLMYSDWSALAAPTAGANQAINDSYTVNGQDTYALIQQNSSTLNSGTAVSMTTTAPTSGAQISHLYFEMLSGAPAAPSAPVINSFSASPTSVPQGNSSSLSWSVSGNPAPTISIDNGLGTQAGTSVNVSPSVTTTYTLTASNSQGNATAQSTVTVTAPPPPDTTPPSTPTNLSATAISSSQINLSWTASTDNTSVTGYKIFRGGVQIGTSATNSYSDSGLTASTNYSYTVSAYDAAGNNSVQSSSASATTQAVSSGSSIGTVDAFIDMANTTLGASINASVMSAGTIGSGLSWNTAGGGAGGMSVGPHHANSTLLGSVKVGGVTYPTSHTSQSIAYDNAFNYTGMIVNLPSGHSAVTTSGWVTLGPASASNGSLLDLVTIDNGGTDLAIMQLKNNTTPSNYNLSIETVFGSTKHSAYIPVTPGGTYWYSLKASAVTGVASLNIYDTSGTLVGSVTNTFQTGHNVTDIRYGNQEVSQSPGHTTYFENTLIDYSNAVFPLGPGTGGGGGDVTPPVLSAISASSITQTGSTITWTTDESSDSQVDYGLTTGYGSSSTLNSSLVTSHSVSLSSLTAGTTYHYRVKSKDASGNLATSGDNTFTTSAAVLDTTPPSTPANLSATAVSSSNINLSWTASTDNTAVTGYKIFRNGTQINTSATNSYSDSGLTASTLYSYTVSAYDAASNNSVQSSSASATTLALSAGPTYYVDQTAGSDSNNGTSPATPWKNSPGMTACVSVCASTNVLPGSTIYFDSNDTWSLTGGQGLYLIGGVTYIGNGWGTINAAHPRGALMFAASDLDAGVIRFRDDPTHPTIFQGFEVNANHTVSTGIDLGHRYPALMTGAVKRVDNVLVHGVTSSSAAGTYKYGIIISSFKRSDGTAGNISNVEILNSTVYDISRTGIALYPGDDISTDGISNITVRGNEVYNTGTDGGTTGSGIMAKGNVQNATIEYNYVHDTGIAELYVNTNENTHYGFGPTNIHFRYNIVKADNIYAGIRIADSNNGGPTGDPKDVKFYGNIVYSTNNSYGFLIDTDLENANNSIILDNNTFYNAPVKVNNTTAGFTNFEVKNNIAYYPSGTAITGSAKFTSNSNNITTNPTFKNTANIPTGFVGTYPNFVPNNDGLSVVSGSNSIDTGATLASPYNSSINSLARPQGAAFDVGAYEFASGGGGGDTTAPSIPTSLSATAISSSAVNLSWTASSDNVAVTGYKIYRGGVQVGTSATNSYSDSGLTASTAYTYTVSANDAAGNNSAQSTSASATTQPPPLTPDITPPTVTLTSPSAGSVSGTITLSATGSDPAVGGAVTSGLFQLSLLVDGSVSGATSPTSPISHTLDTTTLTNGTHTISAKGQDNAGNITTTPTVTITVNNVIASKFPRTLTLTSIEGLSALPSNQPITATILSGASTLETQSNLLPIANTYTITFLSTDPQLVNIRIKTSATLSQLLSNIDTTINSASPLSVPALTAGDFNNDNTINALDFSLMNTHWLQNFAQTDVNGDGLINTIDFGVLKNNFNKVGQ